ncbi:hypothetical protein SBA6_30020 [Candidatus Sulfopaludibacter sp. SbA6]|nr:hypothetical protein SBA6_30020 [Candidatus Sulfopaludibacter sp. SbA6]
MERETWSPRQRDTLEEHPPLTREKRPDESGRCRHECLRHELGVHFLSALVADPGHGNRRQKPIVCPTSPKSVSSLSLSPETSLLWGSCFFHVG